MDKNVRKVADGAMMVAIITTMMLIDRYFMGIFGSLLFIVCFPMVVYGVKYGLKNSIAPLISVFFLTILFGNIPLIFIYNTMSICGAIYGSLARKKVNKDKLLIFALASLIFANLVITVLFAEFFGYNITEEIKMIETLFNSFSVEVVPSVVASSKFFLMFYIFSMVLFGIISGIMFHYFSIILLKRLKLTDEFYKINKRYVPKPYVGYIAFALVILFMAVVSMENIPEIIVILLMIFSSLALFLLLYYGLLGMMEYLLKKIGRPLAFIVAITVIMFINITLMPLCFVGFTRIIHDKKYR
ncbi:MAG: DUF2232 domain-containing protein [Anaerorhabdus sp.]